MRIGMTAHLVRFGLGERRFRDERPQPGVLGLGNDLVTAMLKNDGQKKFALKTGNAQSGALTTAYDGQAPAAGV